MAYKVRLPIVLVEGGFADVELTGEKAHVDRFLALLKKGTDAEWADGFDKLAVSQGWTAEQRIELREGRAKSLGGRQ